MKTKSKLMTRVKRSATLRKLSKTIKINVGGRKLSRNLHTIQVAIVATMALFTLSATGGASAQTVAPVTEDIHDIYQIPAVASDALFTPPSYLSSDVSAWTPKPGDKLEVNVETNMGRLIHTDGESVQFEIVSGQRRVVRYIGRRYFAATPAQNWVVRETVIKKDRWTFGKTGRFIRLYKVTGEGEKRVEEHTAYGIHPFGNENSMFKVPGRYGSMGCVIMREDMVDIIQQTIKVNGGSMEVRTFPDMPQE